MGRTTNSKSEQPKKTGNGDPKGAHANSGSKRKAAPKSATEDPASQRARKTSDASPEEVEVTEFSTPITRVSEIPGVTPGLSQDTPTSEKTAPKELNFSDDEDDEEEEEKKVAAKNTKKELVFSDDDDDDENKCNLVKYEACGTAGRFVVLQVRYPVAKGDHAGQLTNGSLMDVYDLIGEWEGNQFHLNPDSPFVKFNVRNTKIPLRKGRDSDKTVKLTHAPNVNADILVAFSPFPPGHPEYDDFANKFATAVKDVLQNSDFNKSRNYEYVVEGKEEGALVCDKYEPLDRYVRDVDLRWIIRSLFWNFNKNAFETQPQRLANVFSPDSNNKFSMYAKKHFSFPDEMEPDKYAEWLKTNEEGYKEFKSNPKPVETIIKNVRNSKSKSSTFVEHSVPYSSS